MHYIDTSIIAAILLRDPESKRAENLLDSLRSEDRCLSAWTGVELFSAIGRRARTREMTSKAAANARLLYFEEFAAKLILLPIGTPDFERACALLAIEGTGLRGGDALHLAIALNRGVTSFRTLDKSLRKIAIQMGLSAPSA